MAAWRSPRLLLSLGLAATLLTAAASQIREPAPVTAFAGLVQSLSEPGGYFDTDNLISNERTYLSVIPALRRAGAGGAYVGVGPDQNFSYIAALRPEAAFILDIRRDNLLLHLLFKALFELSPTRIEYLANLTGRPIPADAAAWRGRSIDAIADYLDAAGPLEPAARERLAARVAGRIERCGVSVTVTDKETIRRFHDRFIAEGLTLRFESFGRRPQYYYPTYRQLLVATDEDGRQSGFLASEDGYGVVRDLQRRDGVVPVTGNLAGPHALRAIGAHLRARGLTLRALYASNVEFYLYRDGSLGRFYDNLAAVPAAPSAVLIRSEFGGGASSSSVEPVSSVLAGRAERPRPWIR